MEKIIMAIAIAALAATARGETINFDKDRPGALPVSRRDSRVFTCIRKEACWFCHLEREGHLAHQDHHPKPKREAMRNAALADSCRHRKNQQR